MAALAEMKQEWKAFKDDEPGHRFEHHRERMQHRSRAVNAIALVAGIALLAAGVLFCFLPGPGTILIVFGLALVGARWCRMAKLMDRAEPALRRFGRRQKRRWQAMPGHARLGVMLSLSLFAVAGLIFIWRFVVAGYLLH